MVQGYETTDLHFRNRNSLALYTSVFNMKYNAQNRYNLYKIIYKLMIISD